MMPSATSEKQAAGTKKIRGTDGKGVSRSKRS